MMDKQPKCISHHFSTLIKLLPADGSNRNHQLSMAYHHYTQAPEVMRRKVNNEHYYYYLEEEEEEKKESR